MMAAEGRRVAVEVALLLFLGAGGAGEGTVLPDPVRRRSMASHGGGVADGSPYLGSISCDGLVHPTRSGTVTHGRRSDPCLSSTGPPRDTADAGPDRPAPLHGGEAGRCC